MVSEIEQPSLANSLFTLTYQYQVREGPRLLAGTQAQEEVPSVSHAGCSRKLSAHAWCPRWPSRTSSRCTVPSVAMLHQARRPVEHRQTILSWQTFTLSAILLFISGIGCGIALSSAGDARGPSRALATLDCSTPSQPVPTTALVTGPIPAPDASATKMWWQMFRVAAATVVLTLVAWCVLRKCDALRKMGNVSFTRANETYLRVRKPRLGVGYRLVSRWRCMWRERARNWDMLSFSGIRQQ